MSTDLQELAYNLSASEQSPGYPTEADLNHGPPERRRKAWRHVLIGKKLLRSTTPVAKDMETTHVSTSILPRNHRIIAYGCAEFMDYDEDRLTIELDEEEKVREVSFR